MCDTLFTLFSLRARGVYVLCLLCGLSLVVSSCAEDDEELYASGKVSPSFTADLSGTSTRVSDTGWSAGDKDRVGIYMQRVKVGSTGEDEAFGSAQFKLYKPSGTSLTPDVADDHLYYPAGKTQFVKFVAFAPCTSASKPANHKVTYTLSAQNTQAAMEAVNFIYCDTKNAVGTDKNRYFNSTNPEASLTFNRKLSKVIVIVDRADGTTHNLTTLTAGINSLPNTIECNLETGVVTAGASGAQILLKTTSAQANAKFELIVAPHTNTNRTVEFKLGGTSFSTNKIGQEYEAGYSYTYNYTVTQSGVQLTATNIDDWDSGDVSWVGENYMSTDKNLTLDGGMCSGLITIKTNAGTPVYTLSGTNTGWLTPGSKVTPAGTDTYTLSYTAAANPNTTSRTANIALKAGKVVLNITVVQLARRPTIDPSKPIIQNEDANCFILAPGGNQVLIPVKRADDYAEQFDFSHPRLNADEDFYAELLWVDEVSGNPTGSAILADKIISSANVIQQLGTIGSGPTGHILVQSGNLPGNAVVTLKKKLGENLYTTLWSWHIWVTAQDPRDDKKAWTYNDVMTYFMDRNLGAASAKPTDGAKTYGLHYQWGRKDPFPHTDSSKPFWIRKADGTYESRTDIRPVGTGPVSISTAVVNPDIFYTYDGDWCLAAQKQVDGRLLRWMNKSGKAFDDPCPQWWKVPNDGVWNGITEDNFPWDTTNKGRSNDAIGWYPAAGFRNETSGSLYAAGSNGCYWSATRSTYEGNAYYLLFFDDFIESSNYYYPATGHSVRCVQEND